MRIKSHKTLYTYRLIVSGVKFVIVIPIKLAPCRTRMRIESALVYLMTLRLIKIIELLLFLMMTQSERLPSEWSTVFLANFSPI